MLDNFKQEQPIAYKILKMSAKKDKISHAYLLELNGYSSGLDFAMSFAKFLLCPKNKTNNENCGKCTQCQTIDSGNHLEIKIIEPDGQWIKKEQIIDLQQEFNKKAVVGDKKIYIINGAEKLNSSSANSMLKFLEEPAPGITAILLTENANAVMETIFSRCQTISLRKSNMKSNEFIEKLIEHFFNNQTEKEETLSAEEIEDKIDFLIAYIDFYEKNGLKTIIHRNKEFLTFFPTKETLSFAFNCMILYYKDVINFKLERKCEFFEDYLKNIEETANNNKLEDLASKIKTLIEVDSVIKFNANATMLLDRMIIELEEVQYD